LAESKIVLYHYGHVERTCDHYTLMGVCRSSLIQTLDIYIWCFSSYQVTRNESST